MNNHIEEKLKRLEELEKNVIELRKAIENWNPEEKKETEYDWWVPKSLKGRTHFLSTLPNSMVDSRIFITNEELDYLQENANCYHSSELHILEKDAKTLDARQRIQRTADKLHGKRYEFENRGCWIIEYNVFKSCFEINCGRYFRKPNQIYFETREIAEECLDLRKKDFEFLCGVSGK